MANDVNLTSREWLNLVFEGKNKAYGAYVLRRSSSNHHVIALLSVVLLGLSLAFLPDLLPTTSFQKPVVKQTVPVELTIVQFPDVAPKKEPVAIDKPTPLPSAVKSAVQFTEPKIVPDEIAGVDAGLPTQAALTETGADISTQSFDGVVGGTTHIDDVVPVAPPVEVVPVIHVHPDQAPVFDGLMQWLGKNINYPVSALERGVEGRVILRFVVGPDGTVSNVEVQRSLDPSCDREAVRVVKNMPKWVPGKVNGNPVHTYFTLPVLFKIQK